MTTTLTVTPTRVALLRAVAAGRVTLRGHRSWWLGETTGACRRMRRAGWIIPGAPSQRRPGELTWELTDVGRQILAEHPEVTR